MKREYDSGKAKHTARWSGFRKIRLEPRSLRTTTYWTGSEGRSMKLVVMQPCEATFSGQSATQRLKAFGPCNTCNLQSATEKSAIPYRATSAVATRLGPASTMCSGHSSIIILK